MIKTCMLIVFCLSVFFIQAQRFFYVESNSVTNRIIKQRLTIGAQNVTSSALASDYIIKTGVGIGPETRSLQINITLQDSITLKTIYQAKEEYRLSFVNNNTRLHLKMLIQGFVESNLAKIIDVARDDHNSAQSKYLSPRKDKT